MKKQREQLLIILALQLKFAYTDQHLCKYRFSLKTPLDKAVPDLQLQRCQQSCVRLCFKDSKSGSEVFAVGCVAQSAQASFNTHFFNSSKFPLTCLWDHDYLTQQCSSEPLPFFFFFFPASHQDLSYLTIDYLSEIRQYLRDILGTVDISDPRIRDPGLQTSWWMKMGYSLNLAEIIFPECKKDAIVGNYAKLLQVKSKYRKSSFLK